jgi:hypothetical protein
MKFEAEKRVTQLKANTSWKHAGVYDPDGVGGTHVIYVLGDAREPEKYGGLPANPTIPIFVKLWKGPLKWLGGLGIAAGVLGVFMHRVRYGVKEVEGEEKRA